jgi:peptidyl-tRNA hydrolase, PTH1 family
MKLIVGLGNPGSQYERTRHNVGFMVVDRLAQQAQVPLNVDKAFKAHVAKTTLYGQAVILAKPQTYMNLSGDSVGPIARYYKVELDDILVICDEVSLPFGRLRIRPHGSDGGQNGMKHIITALGSNQFPRLRLGVGPQPAGMPLENYVLQAFPQAQQDQLPTVLDTCQQAIALWMRQGVEPTRNQFNGWSLPVSPQPGLEKPTP